MKNKNRIILFSHSENSEVSDVSVSIKEEMVRFDNQKKYNEYYLGISELYKKLQMIGVLALVAYFLITVLFFGESITYKNARYVLRDLGQILTEDTSPPLPELLIDPDGQMDFAIYNNNIVIAGESGVKMITPSGKVRLEDSIIYKDPKIISAQKYCIVYSPGAYNLSVYNTITRVYDFKFDYPIIDVSTSDNGDIAVMTSSREYRTTVYRYNSDFALVATYNSTKYPSSVSLSEDGEILYVCVFSTDEGDYITMLNAYNKTDKAPVSQVSLESILPYQICTVSDSLLVLISELDLIYYDRDLQIQNAIRLDSGISKYSLSHGYLSLFTSDKSPTVISIDKSSSEIYSEISDPLEKSYCYDGRTFVLTRSSVIYTTEGGTHTIESIPPGAQSLLYNKNYLYVCYSDKILSIECK